MGGEMEMMRPLSLKKSGGGGGGGGGGGIVHCW